MRANPQLLLPLWNRLSKQPGGRWLFSRIVGFMVPYSQTIGATIVTLTPGHCRATLLERRSVRNHLGSVHAMALANFGEFASGLALLTALPQNRRGIVTGFKVEYFKKARGKLTAEASITVRADAEVLKVFTQITNQQGEKVAETTADWKIGPT